MEKMTGAGEYHDRKMLRTCPGECVLERHHVVVFAVHHQSSGRNGADLEAPDCGRHQDQMPGFELSSDRGGDETAERKSAQRKLAFTVGAARMLQERPEILYFTLALVEYALAGPDAAEIQPQRTVACRQERFRKSLNNLVIERTSVERMRMRDQCNAAARLTGIIGNHLESTRRSVNREPVLDRRFQMRRRSTMRPCTRCSSMISSISLLST